MGDRRGDRWGRAWQLIGRALAACALACTMVFALAGCGALGPDPAGQGGQSGQGGSGGSSTDAAPVAIQTQDKRVTFPASFFSAKNIHDPQAYLERQGYTDVVANDDGTYAALVPGDAYNSLLDEVYALAASIIDDIPDDPKYPHVVAVDYDRQFATVTVSFDTTAPTDEEMLVSRVPGEAACMYQQMAGLPLDCDVILVGPDGSELANTMYPVKTAASSSGETASAGA